MIEVESFELKKSLRQESQTGITFHWLKYAFGDCFENAVRDAIHIVYFPSAIAFFTNGTDRGKVIAALEQSRKNFNRWMDFAQQAKPVTKQSPERVLVDVTFSVDDSGAGIALDWLLKKHPKKTEKMILDAVLLLYLPSVLYASGDPHGRLSIMRSLTVITSWLQLSGYPFPVDDFVFRDRTPCCADAEDVSAEFQSLRNTHTVQDLSLEGSVGFEDTGHSTPEEAPQEPNRLDDMPEINYDYDF